MTVSDELLDTFRWYRAAVSVTPRGGNRRPMHAADALAQARHDIAKGSRRYGAPSLSCLTWQPDKPGLAYVDKPEAFGLRHVGNVESESYGGRNCWNRSDSCGWYTDPHGDVFKDGTGLCWGVVYELPSRHGCALFVAGYQFGGTDSGPTLDLSTIYKSIGRAYDWDRDRTQYNAAREAAQRADDMAKEAAELERDYQTAWQAGTRWAELGDDIATIRQHALALGRERRAARGAEGFPTICETVRAAITKARDKIERLRSERAKLASGDANGLIFYPDDKTRPAFNEGAGEAVLS